MSIEQCGANESVLFDGSGPVRNLPQGHTGGHEAHYENPNGKMRIISCWPNDNHASGLDRPNYAEYHAGPWPMANHCYWTPDYLEAIRRNATRYGLRMVSLFGDLEEPKLSRPNDAAYHAGPWPCGIPTDRIGGHFGFYSWLHAYGIVSETPP